MSGEYYSEYLECTIQQLFKDMRFSIIKCPGLES